MLDEPSTPPGSAAQPAASPPATLPPVLVATSWDELDAQGSGLRVDDFLTTLLNLTSNVLRRSITLPYAQQFGLTMPEWRIISVLAEAGEIPFADLVVRSATDKGQLSRTLRTLQERDLVATRAGAGKKVDCLITPAGLALHKEVMPVAQLAQATMIRQLSSEERRALYTAMKKLRDLCGGAQPGG